jgi:DNA-binding beta-propeller fold protein YncE
VTSGCGQQATTVPTGGDPVSVAFDATNNTVYVSDNADGEVSLFAPPS